MKQHILCVFENMALENFWTFKLENDTRLNNITWWWGHDLYYLLTPSFRVLLEKLTGLQLVKKFLEFHRTRRFITALTSVRHLSLSWTSPIQSMYAHPTSWRSILILSIHLRLGLPSGLLPTGFPSNALYTSLSSPIRATCSAHLILLDFWARYDLYYSPNIIEQIKKEEMGEILGKNATEDKCIPGLTWLP